VQGIATPPQAAAAQATIAGALHELQLRYAAAAAAAGAQNRSGYASAGRALSSASARLQAGLRELQALGYTVAT
jgi:hypothetical protein